MSIQIALTYLFDAWANAPTGSMAWRNVFLINEVHRERAGVARIHRESGRLMAVRYLQYLLIRLKPLLRRLSDYEMPPIHGSTILITTWEPSIRSRTGTPRWLSSFFFGTPTLQCKPLGLINKKPYTIIWWNSRLHDMNSQLLRSTWRMTPRRFDQLTSFVASSGRVESYDGFVQQKIAKICPDTRYTQFAVFDKYGIDVSTAKA